MPGFTGYTPDASLVPSDSDRYVSELEADKDILKNALDKAVSSEEIHDAYNAYYKSSYGYLMDEAKGHNVVLADVQIQFSSLVCTSIRFSFSNLSPRFSK